MSRKFTTHRLILIAILALSGFLEVFLLWKNGYGNPYYAATVKSMTQSWHNFLYVSFDPGGFVSADKPPFALWIQALFVKLFGFTGVTLLLPQALAQMAAVWILFTIVKKTSGYIAGLIAAFVLAVTPINVVLSRTNNVDGILVLILLGAAWAFMRALQTEKIRYLLLSFALIGLGFNTKMLEAYIVVPAFVATYLIVSSLSWVKKSLHLLVALSILLIVSLSWVMLVDRTPPGSRPYVGSSQNNTEFNLALGYNGVERVTGALEDFKKQARPTLDLNANTPGPLRLLDRQFGGQIGWLLAFAAVSFVGILITEPLQGTLSASYLMSIFWGIWMMSCVAVFSISGTLHTYYTSILAPAIAALVGMGGMALWREYKKNTMKKWLLPGALMLTALTQVLIVSYTPSYAQWLTPVLLGGSAVFVGIFVIAHYNAKLTKHVNLFAVFIASLGVLTLSPVVWSGYSVFHPFNMSMPAAGPTQITPRINRSTHTLQRRKSLITRRVQSMRQHIPWQSAFIHYLVTNQGKTKFLLATENSMMASPLILATGKPIMPLGGYSGKDKILTLPMLKRDIAGGVIRFFLLSAVSHTSRMHTSISQKHNANEDLFQWVVQTCTVVPTNKWSPYVPQKGSTLYDCTMKPKTHTSITRYM